MTCSESTHTHTQHTHTHTNTHTHTRDVELNLPPGTHYRGHEVVCGGQGWFACKIGWATHQKVKKKKKRKIYAVAV
jgi:hypothetical protein